jgi:putative heme iron utilization protein
LRAFPHASIYCEQRGFRYCRLRPLRFHWNSGFATALWFGTNRIRTDPLSPEAQRRIIEHMNQDHRDALGRRLRFIDGAKCEGDVVMVGIDAEGLDIRVADRRQRSIPPWRPNGSHAEAREVLVEMDAQPGGY